MFFKMVDHPLLMIDSKIIKISPEIWREVGKFFIGQRKIFSQWELASWISIKKTHFKTEKTTVYINKRQNILWEIFTFYELYQGSPSSHSNEENNAYFIILLLNNNMSRRKILIHHCEGSSHPSFTYINCFRAYCPFCLSEARDLLKKGVLSKLKLNSWLKGCSCHPASFYRSPLSSVRLTLTYLFLWYALFFVLVL